MPFDQIKSDKNRDGFCFDTLVALIERGPLEAGDVPSKGGLGEFLKRGYAVQIIQNGATGYSAATPLGAQLYINHVGADNLKEAIAKRKAHWAIMSAQQASRPKP
jgi:hypothetical protein